MKCCKLLRWLPLLFDYECSETVMHAIISFRSIWQHIIWANLLFGFWIVIFSSIMGHLHFHK
jgi:uncharacterized membrane protein